MPRFHDPPPSLKGCPDFGTGSSRFRDSFRSPANFGDFLVPLKPLDTNALWIN